MDLEIDIECRHCGHGFSQSLSMMEHGRALRCPFCASFSLILRWDHPVETPVEVEAFDRHEDDNADGKVKTEKAG